MSIFSESNSLLVQYYMPPIQHVNKDFLKAVFSEEKALMKKEDVAHVEVPFYDELSVKALWPQFVGDKEFCKYLSCRVR